jgi:hypothetical protein
LNRVWIKLVELDKHPVKYDAYAIELGIVRMRATVLRSVQRGSVEDVKDDICAEFGVVKMRTTPS